MYLHLLGQLQTIGRCIFLQNPVVLEVKSLENTDRGNKGFGLTGVKATSESINSVTKDSSMSKISANDAKS